MSGFKIVDRFQHPLAKAEDVPQSPLVSELGSLPLTALSYAESVDASSLPASSRRPESAKGSLQTSKKASGGSSARSSKASRPSRPLSAALARPAHSSSSQGSGPDMGRRVASQEKENHPELVPPDPDLGSEHPGPKNELAKRFETIFRRGVSSIESLAGLYREIQSPPSSLSS